MMNDANRYERNIMLKEIGNLGQEKLLKSKILVIGAGGLGSSVIANLSALGVGTLGIVDSDDVDESNLNRQFIHSSSNVGLAKTQSAKQWVQSFNPDIKVETYEELLDKQNAVEIIEKYDVIVDCVDNFGAKFLINKTCVELAKGLVHGGVEEFSGQVFSVVGQKTACLGCLFDNFEHNYTKGIISPVVSVIGSLQAAEVAKLVVGLKNPLTDCVLRYDFLEARFQKIDIAKNSDCKVCGSIPVSKA